MFFIPRTNVLADIFLRNLSLLWNSKYGPMSFHSLSDQCRCFGWLVPEILSHHRLILPQSGLSDLILIRLSRKIGGALTGLLQK